MEIVKTLKFLTIVILGFFVLIYVVVVSYTYFNQVEMVFQSQKLPENHQFGYAHNFEELTIPSFDGAKLNGLLFKAENSKGLIFYLHGNAGTLETWGNIGGIYTNLGYDIFILITEVLEKAKAKLKMKSS